MASKFSDEILKALENAQPLNAEKCAEIAEKFGEKQRALIACAKRNGMEYQRKERTTKAGEKPVTKEALVKTIADNLSISVDKVDGLDKANKTALEVLVKMTKPVETPSES